MTVDRSHCITGLDALVGRLALCIGVLNRLCDRETDHQSGADLVSIVGILAFNAGGGKLLSANALPVTSLTWRWPLSAQHVLDSACRSDGPAAAATSTLLPQGVLYDVRTCATKDETWLSMQINFSIKLHVVHDGVTQHDVAGCMKALRGELPCSYPAVSVAVGYGDVAMPLAVICQITVYMTHSLCMARQPALPRLSLLG